MTDAAPTTTSSSTTQSSSTRTIVIAILAVLVLAGGAFVVYKLTNKKDTGPSVGAVAQQVEKAAASGDHATVVRLSTTAGVAKLDQFKASDFTGLTFGSCGPTFVLKTRVCTFLRPGGQLNLLLAAPNGKWVVTGATLGPAGLPPTAPPTTPPSS